MNIPSLKDLKDYFLVGGSILFLGSLIALPFTVGISLIAHEGMSLAVILFLLAVDFWIRATAMGAVTYYAYIGETQ